jgi:hypothetical protein
VGAAIQRKKRFLFSAAHYCRTVQSVEVALYDGYMGIPSHFKAVLKVRFRIIARIYLRTVSQIPKVLN